MLHEYHHLHVARSAADYYVFKCSGEINLWCPDQTLCMKFQQLCFQICAWVKGLDFVENPRYMGQN